MTIRHQLTLSFLLMALAPLGVTAVMTERISEKMLTQQVLERLQTLAVSRATRVEAIFGRNLERLALVSSRTQLRQSLKEYLETKSPAAQQTMNGVLLDVRASVPSFGNLFVLDGAGEVVASTDPTALGTNHSQEDYFLRGSVEPAADIFSIDEARRPVVHLAGPLTWKGRSLGVLRIDADAENLYGLTRDPAGLGETGETILAKRNVYGDAVFLMPGRFDEKAARWRTLSRRNVNAPITYALLRKQRLFTDAPDYRGETVFAATRYIDKPDWGLVVKMDQSEALASIAEIRNVWLIIVLVSLLAILLPSMAIARSITRPIRDLTLVASRISEGDFSQRVVTWGAGEIGTLAHAFNHMATRVVEAKIGLERRVEERTAELVRSNAELEELAVVAKRAEESLQVEQEFLKAVLHNLKAGIVACDAQGYLTVFNRATREFHGLPEKGIPADEWAEYYDLFQADAKTRMRKEKIPLFRALQGEVVDDVEMVIAPRHGETRTILASGQAIFNAQGTKIGAVVAMHDITERKAIERMKDEFIATVSHELRTPLTSIQGHLELVLDGDAGPVTETQKSFLEVASQSTERLGLLINDLLDMEMIIAGKMRLRMEPVDVGGLLREVASTFRLVAERKGLTFREQAADLPAVLGDRDRLVQVFNNLLSNATKYTPAGEVGVGAAVVDGHVEVVVHDTGIGMSTEEQEQLFKKFFRSQEAVVREAGGTGLGLAIVKEMVAGHGGRIQVESRKGAGTRVQVSLPVAPTSISTLTRREMGQGLVLVIEDVDALRELLADDVRKMGHQCVAAAGGTQALSLARHLRPDLILLDALMPMGAWEVLDQLQTDPLTRAIPVTLHVLVEDGRGGLQVAVTDYLGQTIGSVRLRQAVLGALSGETRAVYLVDPDPEQGKRLEAELHKAAAGGKRLKAELHEAATRGLVRRGRALAVTMAGPAELSLDDDLPISNCTIRQAVSVAEARAIRPDGPSVILLNRELPDGEAGELVRSWRQQPAFRDAIIFLIGRWPRTTDRPRQVTMLRVEGEGVEGEVSEAELTGQLQNLIERWRGAR